MLTRNNTGLMIIDVQGKLAELMVDHESLFTNLRLLIQAAKLFELPVVWMEQLPDKLGPTRPEIAELLEGDALIKNTFSGLQTEAIARTVKSQKMQNWLVAGLETHVCVYQTVSDLLREKYDVHLVTDAVSSRSARNRALGIEKMQTLGAQLTSVEMVLFELQRVAEGLVFKELIKLIK